MSASGGVFALTAKQGRGWRLSPGERILVDHYWRRQAEERTPEQRQEFLAKASRGLKGREDRVQGWRFVLFLMIWWVRREEPVWHDFYDCFQCHPWPEQSWIGPYDLGEDVDTHSPWDELDAVGRG